eukprot:m.133359 g.133359  ORF g.133359 m.133359 type:complete len:84 (+) comp15799_c0_seq1:186-437(+)
MFSGLFDCISYMFLCGDGQNKATGLLFNTPDDFLECAKQLMSDDDLRRRLCENAAEYVARCHSLEVEQRRYIDVVQRYLLDQI